MKVLPAARTWDHTSIELFKDVLTGAVYPESAWRLVSSAPSPPFACRTRQVGRWISVRTMKLIDRLVSPWGITLVKIRAFDAVARNNGKDWPLVGYTMIGRRRLDHLQSCVETVVSEKIPGDFIEAGVWRGGAVMLMKAVLQQRRDEQRILWLADSFAGLPPPESAEDGVDLSWNRFLAVDTATVAGNLQRFGLLDERVKFLPGLFADTLPQAPIARLSILRLDGDLYSSTRDTLKNLYPRVSPGGFVIVDDYYSWPPCQRAVQEYLAAAGQRPEIHRIDDHSVFWRV